MKLFVGNISQHTTEQSLRDALAAYEPILEFRRPTDRETGDPRGFAFITFASKEAGIKAMATINELKLDGRQLRADEAVERSRSSESSFERPGQVSLKVDVARVDDRPVGPDGKKVRYKAI